MSFGRLIYYSAVVGGWAALMGWAVAELCGKALNVQTGYLQVVMFAGFVGGLIGMGLMIVSRMTNPQWSQLFKRAPLGFIGGGIGGAIGGVLGNLLYVLLIEQLGSPTGWTVYAAGMIRAAGWMVMGMGAGIVDGLVDRSKQKIRNGLIGGAIGGLIGGLMFDPISAFITSQNAGTGMASRATSFVILGIFIGLFIGLVQVVLKEAWLTVLDGYGTGRQLVLTEPVTILGRADHLRLPFIGPMNAELNPEHLSIERQASGTFVIEDKNSKLGTFVNHQRLTAKQTLNDNDVVKLGTNFVRFNERRKTKGDQSAPVERAPQQGVKTAPPPPPRKKSESKESIPKDEQTTRKEKQSALAGGPAASSPASEPPAAAAAAKKAPLLAPPPPPKRKKKND